MKIASKMEFMTAQQTNDNNNKKNIKNYVHSLILHNKLPERGKAAPIYLRFILRVSEKNRL